MDTVSDTTSDPNYKRAQEDKLIRHRDNEEPHTVPIDHDKEVSYNTGSTNHPKHILTQMKHL